MYTYDTRTSRYTFYQIESREEDVLSVRLVDTTETKLGLQGILVLPWKKVGLFAFRRVSQVRDVLPVSQIAGKAVIVKTFSKQSYIVSVSNEILRDS